MMKISIPLASLMGFTLITLLPTMDNPVMFLMNSSDGIVQWKMEGVRLSLFGCGVTSEHCCWNVSSGVRLMIANWFVPLICEMLMAPLGFLWLSRLRAL
jgi:hypothetical protein